MTLAQFGGLLMVYLLSLVLILLLTYREFQRVRFNFNVFFSVLYLLTFYLGFPFTCLLVYGYGVEIVPVENLLKSLLAATAFYSIYYVSYRPRLFTNQRGARPPLFSISRTEIYLLWMLLVLIAVITVMVFFIHNGFLLFRLHAYSQIFSSDVSGVALKRFFYFFIPAMLLIYFMNPTQQSWIIFLIATVAFGIFTYIVVGGTRANIITGFTLFLFIGIQRGWITLWILASASVAAISGMFWLALKRYGLNVSGNEAFYTFLYLTRDTFSPWENLALLLKNYGHIDFQGLAPIVRDFYVFIPGWLWPDRPSLVLNTANYFTWEVLNNHSGLAISPTLIGSLIVMGGVGFIPLGAIVVGLIIKGFDALYERGTKAGDRYRASLLQSFCFGAVFNMIVLAREGLDAFVSRVVFFCLIFGLCLIAAKFLFLLLRHAGLIQPHSIKLNDHCAVPQLITTMGKIMHNNNSVPHYQIRGLALWGFRNRAEFIDYLFSGRKLKTGALVAINAEKVLSAERDAVLKQLLDEAEYKYADGISIVRSIRSKYRHAEVSRIAGADLWEDLMTRAGKEGLPVFLLGGRPVVLMEAEAQLRTRWNVNIVGRQDGYFTADTQPTLIERIYTSRAAIVTVGMGSPRQEQLIQACQRAYPAALYMGVGGTYDVFTGHVERAPKVWQDLGLEWLYRLLSQPSRLQRQFKLLRYLGYHIGGRL